MLSRTGYSSDFSFVFLYSAYPASLLTHPIELDITIWHEAQ